MVPRVTLLDGPVGTELAARGVPTPAPAWSAWAVAHRPDALAAIHRDYALAGATVHTAATFRTRARDVGAEWERLAARAVRIARQAVPVAHRVAGSIAPLADCYRPDLSPSSPRREHRELARALVRAGADLLLCETFAHPGEALVAVEEAVATGLETWVSLTAGPDGTLLAPAELARAAWQCVAAGASVCLVNCVAAPDTERFVAPLAGLGVPFGAYANAGAAGAGIGWGPAPDGPRRYAALAERWVAMGATVVGSCCGTGPAHVRALAAALTPA